MNKIINISITLFLLVTLSTVSFAKYSGESLQLYSCILKNDNFYVFNGYLENGVAFALIDLKMNETGWNYISINTSSSYPDHIQAQAAGYIEGYLTHQSIQFSKINFFVYSFDSQIIPDNVTTWIQSNINFMESQIQIYKDIDKSSNNESLYWYHVSLVLDQVSYMVQGFNDAVDQNDRLTLIDFFVLNMFGDLIDLLPALIIQGGGTIKPPTTIQEMVSTSHCTSFIKLNYDLSELYCGHTSWNDYSTMVRTFKYYSFGFDKQSNTVNSNQLFSSYPGVISSVDDFYLLENDMIVMETTNDIYNYSLYELVKPESVLSWIRVLVSHRISDSPLEWCETLSNYNSGTYNNQWIVFDYRKFEPSHLYDGALYVLEQVPGYIQYDDQTLMLRNGFWASFNLPFYVDIYNMSGYPLLAQMVNQTLKEQLNYATNCRSEIFRRDANTVYSLTDFMDFMRYNDYTNDPISQMNPGYAISSRYDLLKEKPIAFGGIDSKVISYSLLKQRTVLAINGPTTSHDIAPFNWNENPLFSNITHVGMPDEFNFDWLAISNNSFTPYNNINHDHDEHEHNYLINLKIK